MNHTYITFKSTDYPSDKIIYVGDEEPAENHIKIMKLQKNPERHEWFTYLGKLTVEEVELMFITPCSEEKKFDKHKDKINLYIFKIEEADGFIE